MALREREFGEAKMVLFLHVWENVCDREVAIKLIYCVTQMVTIVIYTLTNYENIADIMQSK